MILAGTNSYTGATTVNGGRLSVNGSLGTSSVSVASGAELGGSGDISGSVSVLSGGTLSPGNSIASLSQGSTTFAAGSTFEYEVDSSDPLTLGSAADLLVVNGNLSIESGAQLSFTDLNATPILFERDTTVFAMINYSGIWDGGVFSYNGIALIDGSQFAVGSQIWQIDYDFAFSNELDNYTGDYMTSGSSKFVVVTAVPEPSAFALVALGAAAQLLRRRRCLV